MLEIGTFTLAFSHIIRNDEGDMLTKYRYLVSKLLEVFFIGELASRISRAAKTSETLVIVNCMTPGWCKSEFMRELSGVAKVLFIGALQAVLGRNTEVGSRALVAGAAADVQSHGEYMENCRVVWYVFFDTRKRK
jgi:retinol dehydrogenase-12